MKKKISNLGNLEGDMSKINSVIDELKLLYHSKSNTVQAYVGVR